MLFQVPLLLAEAPAATTGSPFMTFGLIAVMALFFYFAMYRPQKKQEKESKAMRDGLQIGDEICTTGGILGRVVKIKDEIITLETGSDKNKIKVYKWAVRSVEIAANAEEEEAE